MAKSSPQLFTAEEAARYLRLHVKTVYRLLREGKIPGRKVGGRWRFHRDALEKWLRKEKSTS
jgi:excisionase family DNA binding protein